LNILAIYGSPRKDGNSANMLDAALSEFPQEADARKVFLADLNFVACCASRDCLELKHCPIDDDMQKLYQDMLWAEMIIIGAGSQFGDVTAALKAMIERTWPLRGQLTNKIGGYVVSGRRYIESTLNTLHAFFLRHRMILGGSGALGYGLESIDGDELAIRDSRKTGKRLVELYQLVHGSGSQRQS